MEYSPLQQIVLGGRWEQAGQDSYVHRVRERGGDAGEGQAELEEAHLIKGLVLVS